MMPCPDENVLAAFGDGFVQGREAEAIWEHVDRCASCHAIVVDLAQARSSAGPGSVSGGARDPIDPPAACASFSGGRYTLTRVLGVGGMGVVYEAWDRELARTVAIKRMLTRTPEASALLRHEARSLGSLAHPNVVAVFDVGVADDRAFVVTERLECGSARAWVLARDRSPDEVLLVVADAAAGLQAVHDAGLLHLDVTPNNILVDARGRARVGDFGLARLAPATRSGTSSPDVGGTVGYAAPELLRGGLPRPEADQYGLCATALELLRLAGYPVRALDPALRSALARGMDADPSRRFASMAELRRALTQTRPTRRLAVTVGTLAAATLALAALRPDTAPCDIASAPTPATGVPTVDAAVAEHAARWTMAVDEVCPGARSTDPAWVCLARHGAVMRRILDTPADRLVGAEQGVIALLEETGAPDDCVDVTASEPPPPRAIAERVATIRDEVDAITTGFRIVDPDERLAALGPWLAEAEALEYEPLIASVAADVGRAHLARGDIDLARASLERAAWLAHRHGHDETAGRAWLALVTLHGYRRGDIEAAEALIPFIDASITRRGSPSEAVATRDRVVGSMYDRVGRLDEAEPLLARAVERMRSARGDQSLGYATALETWGVHEARRERFDPARRAFLETQAIFERHLGADHQAVAERALNLAAVALAAMEIDAAIVHARDAIARLEPRVAPDNLRLATARSTLGQALVLDDRAVEGVLHLEAALRAKETASGDTMDAIDARYQLAVALRSAAAHDDIGRDGDARRRRAQELLRATIPRLDSVADPLAARVRHELGQLALERGDLADAAFQCRAAMDLLGDAPLGIDGGTATECLRQATMERSVPRIGSK